MSTLKEVLANFKKELGNTLQAQKNIIDVTQKYIGLLEDAEGGGSGGGIDYSTEEQDTGIKWIDGKTVYQKSYDFGALPNNAEKTKATGISFDKILKIEAIAIRTTDNNTIPIPYVALTASSAVQIGVNASGNISIKTNTDQSTYNAYVTLLYTKSA